MVQSHKLHCLQRCWTKCCACTSCFTDWCGIQFPLRMYHPPVYPQTGKIAKRPSHNDCPQKSMYMLFCLIQAWQACGMRSGMSVVAYL